jgi:hypothetical protein
LPHGNNRDCSAGAFSTWRRGLGIFAVAALTRLPNKLYTCCLILFAVAWRKIGSAFDTVIHHSPHKEGPLREKGKSDRDRKKDCLQRKKRDG